MAFVVKTSWLSDTSILVLERSEDGVLASGSRASLADSSRPLSRIIVTIALTDISDLYIE